jgi:hypothetical protein
LFGNTILGEVTGASITTGLRNTNIGRGAGGNITTGSDNTNIGEGAGASNSISGANTNIGRSSGSSSTSPANTMIGCIAGYAVSAGTGSNVMVGSESGSFVSSSGAPLTDCSNSVFLGQGIRPLNNASNSEIIIGQNGRGLGSYTTVLGNSFYNTNLVRRKCNYRNNF